MNEPVWVKEFAGVVQGFSPEKIPLGAWADALDFEINDDGAVCPRTGFTLYGATPTPDGRGIKTIYNADFDGTTRTLVATDQHVYEFTYATGTWSLVYTITDAGARMTFAMLNAAASPIVVFGNGKINLKQWDGSVVTDCDAVNAPKGRPVAYKNYIVCFECDGAPGKVQFSTDPGDPTAWLLNGVPLFFECRGKVKGLYPFAGGLVVFTEYMAQLFNGDPSAPIGLTTLSETIGCQAQESIKDCGGTLIWLSRAGILGWTGGGAFPSANLSEGKATASNLKRDFRRIAWDLPDGINGEYMAWENAYFLTAQLRDTAAGTPFNRTFKLELDGMNWWPWSAENTALAVVRSPVSEDAGKEMLLGGTSGGYLRWWTDTGFIDTTSSDTTYEYFIESGDIDFDQPDADKLVRAITMGTSAKIGSIALSNRTVTLNLRGDFDRVALSATSQPVSPAGFILDIDRVIDPPATGVALTDSYRYFEVRTPFTIRCKHFKFKIRGSGKTGAIPLYAFMLEWRPGVRRSQLIGR